MADAANAAPGCIGARMTGAGFGGACVALVDRTLVNDFIADAGARFFAAAGRTARFIACDAVDGARAFRLV